MEVNELEKDPDGSPGDEIQPENPSENTEVEQKNKRKNEDDGDHNNNNPSKKPLEELDSLEETSIDVDQQSTIIQHPPPIENPNDIEQQSVVIQRNATETPIAPAAEPTTLQKQDIAAQLHQEYVNHCHFHKLDLAVYRYQSLESENLHGHKTRGNTLQV